jgi:hypothetical protein
VSGRRHPVCRLVQVVRHRERRPEEAGLLAREPQVAGADRAQAEPRVRWGGTRRFHGREGGGHAVGGESLRGVGDGLDECVAVGEVPVSGVR